MLIVWVKAYEGLMMTTFPVSKAGAIFPAAIKRGKFQGTMAAATPKGVYLVKIVCFSLSSMISSGSSMEAMPLNQAMAAPVSTSACGI